MFERAYQSIWHLPLSVVVVPLLFGAWLLKAAQSDSAATDTTRAPRSNLQRYLLLFLPLTIVDPIATGPMLRLLGPEQAWVGSAVMLTFVLLGDYRAFVALHLFARRASWRDSLIRALLPTLIVPVATQIVRSLWPALHDNSRTMFLGYELMFLVWWFLYTAALRGHDAEAKTKRRLVGYVGLYYALWASADALILRQHDAGFALRVVPNQLYYALFLPFVFLTRRPHIPQRATVLQ